MSEFKASSKQVIVNLEVLDDLPGLQQQLYALSVHYVKEAGKCIFQPLPGYLDTILWLLDTNQVSYQLVE